MSAKQQTSDHRHVAKRVHVVVQRGGVPYEIEQQVCRDCGRLLGETPVRRTAA